MGVANPIIELRKMFLFAVTQQRILNHIRNSIADNESIIEDLNAEQMLEGLDSKGNLIRPSYRNPGYAAYKQMLNPKPPKGTPDLNLTGAFQRKLFVKLVHDAFELGSSDQKAKELEIKYGDVIYGLTEKSKAKIPELFLIEDIQNGIKRDLKI